MPPTQNIPTTSIEIGGEYASRTPGWRHRGGVTAMPAPDFTRICHLVEFGSEELDAPGFTYGIKTFHDPNLTKSGESDNIYFAENRHAAIAKALEIWSLPYTGERIADVGAVAFAWSNDWQHPKKISTSKPGRELQSRFVTPWPTFTHESLERWSLDLAALIPIIGDEPSSNANRQVEVLLNYSEGYGREFTKNILSRVRELHGWTPTQHDLRDALQDLARLPQSALEDGDEAPFHTAMTNGRHLVRRMYRYLPRRYEVYLMSNGGVAIDSASVNGKRVVILCNSDGSVQRLVSPRSLHLSKSHPNALSVPDSFLQEALDELDAQK